MRRIGRDRVRSPSVKLAAFYQIVAALPERDIDLLYLVIENEGHGFRNEENKFEVYEAMEAFFEKHLGERAP